MQRLLLVCKDIGIEHAGANVAQGVNDILAVYKLSKTNILQAVVDNGGNIEKACRLLDVGFSNCVAHTLKLIVHDAIDSVGSVKKLFDTAGQVATDLNQST